MNKWLSNKFNWLSLIATFAVVCLHSRNGRWTHDGIDWCDIMQIFLSECFRFAVPLFFIISGFMLVRSYEVHGYLPLIKRKFWSLYVPAILWTTFGIVICLPIRFYSGSDVPTLRQVAEIPLMIFRSEGNHFWFLRSLCACSLVAPLLVACASKWIASLLVIVCAVVVGSCNSWCFCHHLDSTIVYVLIGCMMQIHFKNGIKRLCVVQALVFVVFGAVIICLCLFARDYKIAAVANLINVYAIPISQIVVIWSMYDIIDFRYRIGALPKWLDGHFFVYCVHLIVLSWVGGGMRVAFGAGSWARCTAYFLLYFTFVFDLVLANLCRRIFPRTYAILSGGRN